MNVLLPKKHFNFNNGAAIVEGTTLCIYRPVDFDELMYALTYEIYGPDHKCHYCGKELLYDSDKTLDHRFPVDLGGPSLTNNLVPTCKVCNSTKGNMLEGQFKKFRAFGTKAEANEYRKRVEARQRDMKEGPGILPKEWLSPPGAINVIDVRMHVDTDLGRGYNSVKRKHRKYGTIQKPVIVSVNHKLLDGFNVCLYAKAHNCWDLVKIIVLSNVVVMY